MLYVAGMGDADQVTATRVRELLDSAQSEAEGGNYDAAQGYLERASIVRSGLPDSSREGRSLSHRQGELQQQISNMRRRRKAATGITHKPIERKNTELT